jgi:hypothetical protein
MEELIKLKNDMQDYLKKIKSIILRISEIKEYNASTKDEINQIKEEFLDIVGRGDYKSYALNNCKKSELIDKIGSLGVRLYLEGEEKFNTYSIALDKLIAKENDPKRIVYRKIENDEAELVGESEWFKDSAYRVYQVDGKYYAIVVYDKMNHWLEESTIEEISPSDLDKYI